MTDMVKRLGINCAGVDWLLVKSWLLDEIDSAGAQLERQGIPAGETEFLRGKIANARALIAAAEPVETPEAEDQKDYV